jgi:hypothetical protein
MILANIDMDLDRMFPSIVSVIIFITIALFLYIIKKSINEIEKALKDHIEEWKEFRDKLNK